MGAWRERIRRLLERTRRNRDLDEEIAFHLEMRARDLDEVANPGFGARREARMRFGSPTAVRERTRDVWRFSGVLGAGREFRMAARSLRRCPGFTLSVLLILAIGIGATTAVYSVLDGVLWKSLPFREPDNILIAEQELPDLRKPDGAPAIRELAANFYRFLKEHQSTVEESCAATNLSQNLELGEWPQPVRGALVSPDFFRFFGVHPVRGQIPPPEELRRLAEDHLLISEDTWQATFGGRDDIVGLSVPIGGKRYQVLAVLPTEFRFPTGRLLGAQYWYIEESGFRWDGSEGEVKNLPIVEVFLRTAPGNGVEAVRSEAEALASAYEKEMGASRFRSVIRLTPFTETIARGHRALMFSVFGASLMIALLCALNVSNLMLERFSERMPELSTLASLGASRGVLQRRVLSEAALLAVGGGGCGFAFAAMATPALVKLLPGGLPFVERVEADYRVACFTVVCAVVTTLLFGLLPAWRAGQLTEGTLAPAAGRTVTETRTGWGRSALTAVQVSISVVLLTGALLISASYERASIRDYGFPMEEIRNANVAWPYGNLRPSGERRFELIREMVAAARATPGVVDASATDISPLLRHVWVTPLDPEGGAIHMENVVYNGRIVEPGYFALLGVRLKAGRGFTEDDREGTEKVAILSESMARKLWPGASSLGRKLRIPPMGTASNKHVVRIVGVVPDIQEGALLEDPVPALYMPTYQHSLPYVNILYRVANGTSVEAALRTRFGELQTAKPNLAFGSLSDVAATQLARLRFVFFLLNLFAATAVFVSAAGVFSLLHYSVALRRREFGVRAAIGATPASLLRLVMQRTVALLAAGLALGIPAAIVLSHVLEADLYRVDHTSPGYYLVSALLLGAIALAASFYPARRAANSSPAECLRSE